jgi:hypothetical protein
MDGAAQAAHLARAMQTCGIDSAAKAAQTSKVVHIIQVVLVQLHIS